MTTSVMAGVLCIVLCSVLVFALGLACCGVLLLTLAERRQDSQVTYRLQWKETEASWMAFELACG
jgi:hypothetical protein